MGLPRRDAAYHTYTDSLRWPENVRYELIDGTAYLMSPAPTRLHQEVVGEIYFQVRSSLSNGPCRAYVAPFDVRLPKAHEADDQVDTVLQPDLLLVCDLTKLDERGMRGPPDWVVEVLSPSTSSHDQTIKLAAYERGKVPEVWLVHPTDKVVSVYRLNGNTYSRANIYEMKGTLAVAGKPAVVIDWERVLAVLELDGSSSPS